MSNDPKVFRNALLRFSQAVADKAISRAKEKGRPMNPWDEYEPEFIRARLIEEIGEWLSKFTINDNKNMNGNVDWLNEDDELYDITALAASLWMTHQKQED